MSEPNPIETSGKAARPAWLVGPDLEVEPELESKVDRLRAPRSPQGETPARPAAPESSGPSTWTAAASSVPRLTVVSEGAPAEQNPSLIDEETETLFPADLEEASDKREAVHPSLRPLHEPW